MAKRKEVKISDPLEIHSALRKLKSQGAIFYTWKRGSPDKMIFLSRIKGIEFDSIVFKPTNEDGYHFSLKDELVFYCRDVNLSIISKPKVYHDLSMKISFPKGLVVLSTDELEELDILFLDGKGKAYGEKRKDKRKGPAELKTVTIKRAMLSINSPPTFKNYPLFDLSPNGASFMVEDPGDYIPGTEIEIHGVDGEEFEEILMGEVRSVREMKNHTFKVGVELTYKKKKRGIA